MNSRSTRALLLIAHFIFLISSCARMGNPDGGWYDDTPPKVVSSSPAEQASHVTAKRVIINFDEYIKLEDAQSKVIVSPPQIEMPEIKASGKRIIIELKDTLHENTTYTIDFSDAISDNNEGNPMGNYTFSFSTGDHIDTLEVGGYVLNAQNLEPVKGMLVGLYDNLSDTIFRHQPMMRVSRTDSRGHFVVKGVAPGRYRIYALQDADGNYVFSQKSEMLAFSHDIVEPSWKPDTRQDTVWRDSLHIDRIIKVPYTHFLPDDMTLLAFQETQTDRYLLKTERKEPEKFTFFFSYGHEELPQLKGLNFESDSAFIIEASEKHDTVTYWLRDTMLVNQDTLRLQAQYYMSDSTGALFLQTDTLEMLAKVGYEKRLKNLEKEMEKWQKEQEKKKKRGQPYDSIYPQKFLSLKMNAPNSMSPLQTVSFESPTPLERFDTVAVHLYSQIDSTWYETPFTITTTALRAYRINAEWRPGVEYSLEVDSAGFSDIYGLANQRIKQAIMVQNKEGYSSLTLSVTGIRDTGTVVVQLLNSQDEVVRQSKANGGKAVFEYLKPEKYYVRLYVDFNGNGKWDTGKYDDDLQAEPVYYYREVIECKAKWDVKRDWNVAATPRFRQKPVEITKQKPDKEKQLRNRNAERAAKLGRKPKE